MKGGWAAWVDEQRKLRGWRQVDLVRAANGAISSGQLSRWLDGTNLSPTLDSIRAVCSAFGVSVIEGLLAAGYVTPEEVSAQVTYRPPRPSLSDDELLDALSRRLRRDGELARQRDERGVEGYRVDWDPETLAEGAGNESKRGTDVGM